MSTNQLQKARDLTMPDRESMLRRDPSVQRFWSENRDLLSDAWTEWDTDRRGHFSPDSSLLDPELRRNVMRAWENPSTESSVRQLMEEVAPDLFHFQFFDPERLAELRAYLEDVWDAQIPLRPPYGIVLNRRGAMLDQRSDGYLAAPSFQKFYREMFDTYMRPIARLVFPEVAGYDTQTFGFSINYQPDTDTSIRPHSDASAVTLNINLNVPGEEYTGSTVDFLDRETGKVNALSFAPGMAMIHRGSVPHTAHPIKSGERTNFVLWLYGDGGRQPYEASEIGAGDPQDRWIVPTTTPDGYAPF